MSEFLLLTPFRENVLTAIPPGREENAIIPSKEPPPYRGTCNQVPLNLLASSEGETFIFGLASFGLYLSKRLSKKQISIYR